MEREVQRHLSRWGPLTYMHPENDMHLRTINFLVKLNENFDITRIDQVDTSKLDKAPLWEFVGLEDARLVRWNNKLYMCGVRRDTTTNGVGRMELSEIIITDNYVKEVSRFRIEAPIHKDSYCEKNWMPVLDMPFHFIKWSNPTELVKVDLETQTSKQILLKDFLEGFDGDLRGGSQIIPWDKDKRIGLIHEVELFNNKLGDKDAFYYHRFVVWDKDWNIVKYSKKFNFMNARIEFCCGLAQKDNDLLITFGFQDNAAFLLKTPISLVEELLK
jgi:hypothetical protein